ncbi:DUF805 domain-containing protein [Methylobacterium sp.]|uniref:DUF805 domain-containing protein n=1 Tax=Methylobacterium sp. TaxID=409 RepID=UPI002600066C|nr:DUF805 domain-containing protein [Methylobacterium sp.]MBY0256081.1 DUF805 domain-containing protein [Methylobacterium sp.]
MRPRAALDLVDPRGRLSAPAYRHRVIRLLLAFFGLLCAAIWLAGLGLRWPALLVFGAQVPLAGAALAQTARRLHDRDRTGWWLAPYGVVEALGVLPLERWVDRYPGAVIGLVLAMLGFSAWFLIETLLRPGTPGPNRFGPVPVA